MTVAEMLGSWLFDEDKTRAKSAHTRVIRFGGPEGE